MESFDDSQEEEFKPNSSLNSDSDNFLHFFTQNIQTPEPTFVDMNLNKNNPFLGNKRKSDFNLDDSCSHESDSSFNNSNKSETKKNIFNSQSPNNFDDSLLKEKSYLKNLKFTQDTLVPIKTKIFRFLVGYFFGKEYADDKKRKIKRFDDRINKFKKDFTEYNWKRILKDNGFVISEMDAKKDENKEVIELLEKTPFKYIISVLSDFIENSNNIKIDSRIVERLFNIIDCLLIQQENQKKDKKEEEEKIKKKEKEKGEKGINIYDENDGNNEDLLEYSMENIFSSEILLDIFAPDDNNKKKESKEKNKLEHTNQNIMSTNYISNGKVINFEITKINRKDNLFNRLKTMIILAFEKEFNEKNNTYKFPIKQKSIELEEEKKEKKGKKEKQHPEKAKKSGKDKQKQENKKIIKEEKKYEKQKSNKKINIQTDKKFIQSDFKEITQKLKNQLLESNKVKNIEKLKETPEATKLMEMSKEDYLKNIMNDEVKKEKFFRDDTEEQEENYRKTKCKKMAIEIFNSENLDGLILLTKIMTYDQDNYIKIPDAEKFQKTIQKLSGYETFSLKLSEKETEEIKKRKEKLIKIAKNPMGYLSEKSPKIKGKKKNRFKLFQ